MNPTAKTPSRPPSCPHRRATLVVLSLAAASTGALAHTGHGHDELSTFQGLLHALREPDHLAALALGIVITGALAPWVLLGARKLLAAARRALNARSRPEVARR